jgi:hypothetical protein
MVQSHQKRRLKDELQMKKIPENAHYLGASLFSSGRRTRDFSSCKTSWRLASKVGGAKIFPRLAIIP